MKALNLISLARCLERRRAMLTRFAEIGLEYRVFDAIDGKEPAAISNSVVDYHAFKKIYGRPIRPGEIGCAASHLAVLERIVSSEEDYGIVIEDDVVIREGFTLSDISSLCGLAWQTACLDDDPGIIYPGNPLMWGSHRYRDVDYLGMDQGEFNQHFDSGEVCLLDKALIGTQCYLISVEMAQFVLDYWSNIYRPIDEVYRVICEQGHFRFYHAPRDAWWCAPNFEVPSEITDR